jgi:hypothetical protein
MSHPALPPYVYDNLATVHSTPCWIGRTQVCCPSCTRHSGILGLFFPADRMSCWFGSDVPHSTRASGEIKYAQLAFARRICAPTLEDMLRFYSVDINHFYEDHDPRVGCRYVMNHCERCGARFSDSKLFAPPGGLFSRNDPARDHRIEFRCSGNSISATGCVTPIADGLSDALYVLSSARSGRYAGLASDRASQQMVGIRPERGSDRQDDALRADMAGAAA